ncbi:MAG: RNA polymerase sigma factor [Clostridia bacterium]|nr:RNA polymerase sigma factor [Clostridia bacterium]
MLIYLSVIERGPQRMEFSRIYHRYADSVFRKTLYILKNQQDAEDAVQETWFKVAKNMDRLHDMEERTVGAYIMKIAYNQAITVLRQREKIPLYDEEETELAVTEDALFYLCEQADIADITACFAALPTHYRDVLSLYFFYHHSIPEIARLLNEKQSTINSRFTRGRKQLISLLERRGFHGKP